MVCILPPGQFIDTPARSDVSAMSTLLCGRKSVCPATFRPQINRTPEGPRIGYPD
jgi:hypothetical protein